MTFGSQDRGVGRTESRRSGWSVLGGPWIHCGVRKRFATPRPGASFHPDSRKWALSNEPSISQIIMSSQSGKSRKSTAVLEVNSCREVGPLTWCHRRALALLPPFNLPSTGLYSAPVRRTSNSRHLEGIERWRAQKPIRGRFPPRISQRHRNGCSVNRQPPEDRARPGCVAGEAV